MESVWFDIDLETVEEYEPWKPDSVEWAMGVDWAKLNDLVRRNLTSYPAGGVDLALANAEAEPSLSKAEQWGLFTLYSEPIFATPRQITSGGHRIVAMRRQGVRWALGQCDRADVGVSVDEIHAYLP